jgi:hypothetical protein
VTGIRGHCGADHLVLVCDRCGSAENASTVSGPGPIPVVNGRGAPPGWEGHRGGLGPHFCPPCAAGGTPDPSVR